MSRFRSFLGQNVISVPFTHFGRTSLHKKSNSISICRTVAASRTKQLKCSLGLLDKIGDADSGKEEEEIEKHNNNGDDSDRSARKNEKSCEFQWLRRRRVDGALNRMQKRYRMFSRRRIFRGKSCVFLF